MGRNFESKKYLNEKVKVRIIGEISGSRFVEFLFSGVKNNAM